MGNFRGQAGAARRLRAFVPAACVTLAALAAASEARAACTPAAADNVTATCTGTTADQNAPYGYGSPSLNNLTTTVVSGASVTGTNVGIVFDSGAVDNSGAISGTVGSGITANTTATVTNSGAISGGAAGIFIDGATANVSNSGTISTNSSAPLSGGILAPNATLTVSNSGTVSGGTYGIAGGTATVSNSGTISGAGVGIIASTAATVTNSGTVSGGTAGIVSDAVNVSNSGTISGGTVGILASTTANVSNSGTITGDYGIFAAIGGSSVFNAGTISGGGGGAAIMFSGAGNTLTLAPGSAITGNVLGAGNDTLQLGGTGAATFDVSQLGAAAQYQGFGTFNKVGNSTWTLTGTSTFAGPINVNGGTLSVNGDVTSASGVTVNAGGTLAGTGIVGNTLVSGGIFAPGSGTPGSSMTVNGALGFDAASTYALHLSATSSLASVTGTATLGGATVNAIFANGGDVAKQYTILNAGSIKGSFGALTNANLPANFSDTLTYDATHAYLSLALSFQQPGSGGLNGNQQAVANVLTNSFNANGSIPFVYGALAPAGLTQASGELGTGSQQATFNAMGQFTGLLTDPFMQRGGGTGPAPGSLGFAEDASASAARRPGDAFAMFAKAPPRALEPRWSVWAAGFGGAQSTDGNAVVGSNDTTSRIFGTAVGADYLFSPNTLAGFALAGGGTNFSVNGLGSGRSDLFQAGAYVRHTEGPAYIAAALANGWQDITTDRTATVAGADHLHSRFDANAYSARMEGGYRFAVPMTSGFGVTPYAAAQATTFDLPAYAEQVISGSSAFALSYASKSVTDPRSELGLRTDKSYALDNGVVTLRSRLAWAHDFSPDRSIAATFQALPGASFVVNGAAQARDSLLTTASVETRWRNGWSAAATFEGEFSDVTRSYAGKAVLRYTW